MPFSANDNAVVTYTATQYEICTVISVDSSSRTALIKHSTRGCTATVPLGLLSELPEGRGKRERPGKVEREEERKKENGEQKMRAVTPLGQAGKAPEKNSEDDQFTDDALSDEERKNPRRKKSKLAPKQKEFNKEELDAERLRIKEFNKKKLKAERLRIKEAGERAYQAHINAVKVKARKAGEESVSGTTEEDRGLALWKLPLWGLPLCLEKNLKLFFYLCSSAPLLLCSSVPTYPLCPPFLHLTEARLPPRSATNTPHRPSHPPPPLFFTPLSA